MYKQQRPKRSLGYRSILLCPIRTFVKSCAWLQHSDTDNIIFRTIQFQHWNSGRAQEGTYAFYSANVEKGFVPELFSTDECNCFWHCQYEMKETERDRDRNVPWLLRTALKTVYPRNFAFSANYATSCAEILSWALSGPAWEFQIRDKTHDPNGARADCMGFDQSVIGDCSSQTGP